MPMPMRSSERKRSRAWDLVRDIATHFDCNPGGSVRGMAPRLGSVFGDKTEKDKSVYARLSGVRPGGGRMAAMAEILNQSQDCAQDREPNKDRQRGSVVLVEEAQDMAAIMEAQEGLDGIPKTPTKCERTEELLSRILRRACGDQEWDKRKWRRQQGGNRDGEESPARESFFDLGGPFLGKLALHGLFAAFVSERISNVATDHRAQSSHAGIVGPRVVVAGGKPDSEHIHAAGKGDDGVIGDAEDDKPGTAHTAEPIPDGSGQQ